MQRLSAWMLVNVFNVDVGMEIVKPSDGLGMNCLLHHPFGTHRTVLPLKLIILQPTYSLRFTLAGFPQARLLTFGSFIPFFLLSLGQVACPLMVAFSTLYQDYGFLYIIKNFPVLSGARQAANTLNNAQRSGNSGLNFLNFTASYSL